MSSGENPNLKIEALNSNHDRTRFFCGVQDLDGYFKHYATQDIKRHVAACYVLLDNNHVAGYYTLSSFSILLNNIPADVAKKLPRYPHVPAILLGRLAVDEKYRQRGYGKIILIDALRRSWRHHHEVAAAAVVVDAKTTEAAAFYKNFGFLEFPDNKYRLFLPMTAISSLFKA